MSIKLWRGDCLERMKEIPDKSVDLILCDLPYGITQNKWDSVISVNDLWKQYKRITKPTAAIVLTATPPFSAVVASPCISWFRYSWYWKKTAYRTTKF